MTPDEPGLATENAAACVCESCGRPRSPAPRAPGPSVLVLVLIFAQERLLLMRRGIAPYLGCWAPPGGFVENGESLEQAAVREVEEEVGITLAPSELIPNGIISLPALNQIYVTFIAVLDRVLQLQPQLPEATDARWFGESEYPRAQMWAPANGVDVSELFASARSRRFDFHHQTGDSLRVIRR